MTPTCGSTLSVRGGGARATRAERGGSWAARWAGVRDGVGGRENGPARGRSRVAGPRACCGLRARENGRGTGLMGFLGRVRVSGLGCCWVWGLLGFGLGSLFLFYSISKTNTQILIEFKFQFEFKPSTQTKETMHQHECNNKFLNLDKF